MTRDERPPWGRVLQPDTAVDAATPYLSATPDHVRWGRLPARGDRPVLTVRPGDTVVVDTLSHEGLLEDQGRDPRRFFTRQGVADDAVLEDGIRLAAIGSHDPAVDGPHVVTGPIAVAGTRPGDLLLLRVDRLEPRVPYGVISSRHGRGALPDRLPRQAPTVSVFARTMVDDAGRPRGVIPRGGLDAIAVAALDEAEAHAALDGRDAASSVSFPLHPFLGIMGVATATDEHLHSVPPGPHGGNLDIRLLGEGTTLMLPVQVDGALVYIGDPHFAQGDGEVALTAFEASLRATITLDVIRADEARRRFGDVRTPIGVTDRLLLPVGLDRDLDRAVEHGVTAAVDLLHHRYAMDEVHAYAYLSAAADVNISQVVDLVKGVHIRLRLDDLDDSAARLLQPARPDGSRP